MKRSSTKLSSVRALLACVLIAVACVAATGASGPQVEPARVPVFAGLPMSFEANSGQTDSTVRFLARGSACQLFISPREAVLNLTKSVREALDAREPRSMAARLTQVSTRAVTFRFLGANPEASVAGLGALPGRVNYFLGNDPAKWRADIPT